MYFLGVLFTDYCTNDTLLQKDRISMQSDSILLLYKLQFFTNCHFVYVFANKMQQNSFSFLQNVVTLPPKTNKV